jgi:UDP-N-acetylglucosamine 2-epimerase (hydrolysing)
MDRKKIVFLTGTRADFGKLKSLMRIIQYNDNYEMHIFATGMHMNAMYGYTVKEIHKSGFKNIYSFINHEKIGYMDRVLAKTVDGFSHYIEEIKPDLIVVHGDRVEALAGAIVGSFNNTLVTHVEGGEVSGTIDELIRHSISKLAHIHLVTNKKAKKVLIQLGELNNSIFVIGSPDLDLMNSENLPTLIKAKEYYEIEYRKYAIAMYHPVTTEYDDAKINAKNFVDAIIKSKLNYIIIYPNNDLGGVEILEEYKRLQGNQKVKIFPSLRFEYFLKILKNATFMVGNSSAGIREAPYFNIPSIDIGSRQCNRVSLESVMHCGYESDEILRLVGQALTIKLQTFDSSKEFGNGNSDKLFSDILQQDSFWGIKCQKQFQNNK